MKRIIFFAFFYLLVVGKSAFAEMVYYYHPPESPLDERYIYHWTVLKTSLDLTVKKYGPYSLRPGPFMTEERQLRELLKAGSKLNVMIRETNRDFEKRFLAVKIPIDRGLTSYRVLLIHKKNKDLFKNINSLEELKKIVMGQGAGWGDIKILENAGFTVRTEVYYEKIFDGLMKGDFTAFPRSVSEVLGEFEKRKEKMPDLMIEENILLYYSLPTYFWFARTEEGRKLKARVKEGMGMMLENGTLEKLFEETYRAQINFLKLKKRKLFKLDNPQLPESTPLSDRRLWVDINEPSF